MPVGHKRNHSAIEENRNSFVDYRHSNYPPYSHDRRDSGDSGRFKREQEHHHYHHLHQQQYAHNKRRRMKYSPIDRRNYVPHDRHQSSDYYEQEHKRRNQNYRAIRRSHSITSNYDDRSGHYNFKLDKILSFMGKGTFAKVVECWDRERKSYVAVKIVRSIPKYTDSAEIEVDILEDIGGKCGCIELIDSFMFRKHMCLVFPKYGKSLFDFIKSNRYKGFYLEHVKIFARGLLNAIKYLHCEKKLIHTDLKPENILLVNSEYYIDEHRLKVPKYTDIRVIDFGSATYEDQHHTSIISTRHYRAPEVILDIGWSYPADIWSIGCILIELYTGEAIFQTHENSEHLAMMEKILGKIPKSITKRNSHSIQKYFTAEGDLNWSSIASSRSSERYVSNLFTMEEICEVRKSSENEKFYNFISKLLEYDPSRRISASEALKDPFLQ